MFLEIANELRLTRQIQPTLVPRGTDLRPLAVSKRATQPVTVIMFYVFPAHIGNFRNDSEALMARRPNRAYRETWRHSRRVRRGMLWPSIGTAEKTRGGESRVSRSRANLIREISALHRHRFSGWKRIPGYSSQHDHT